MSMNLKYKYKTIFESPILASSEVLDKKLNISSASIEKLKSLIPESIDLEKNIDLLGVAFNAAVVNKFNKNGDGIDAENAIAIKDYFINKPANIEHDRQNIVGHIVSSSFSSYNNNNLLTNQEVREMNGPFNIALSAVVYRAVNPDFVELLEMAGDPEDPFYQKISTSWEIGFNEYSIAMGGGNDLGNLRIIDNPEEVEDLSKYLKANGGSGQSENGENVYRLITGEIFPLGIGFTSNPAADVKGVAVEQNYYPLETQEEYEDDANNISQNKTKNVIDIKGDKIMEPNNSILEQLEGFLGDQISNKKFSDEAVATVTKIVNDAILEKNQEFLVEKDQLTTLNEELESAKAEFEDKAVKASEEVDLLKQELESATEQLKEIKATQEAQEAAARFDLRMDSINESYQLSEDDSKIVAQEIKDLDETEETFATYQEKLSIVWKDKNKEVIAKREEELNQKIEEEVQKRIESLAQARASETAEDAQETVEATEVDEATEATEESEEVSEEALENAEAKTEEIALNNNAESSESETSLRDKFKQAFHKENITIKY